jgi:hypothetical protein
MCHLTQLNNVPRHFIWRYNFIVAIIMVFMAQVIISRHKEEEMPKQVSPEVVETEVMNLHEGNIARYRLRPSEFQPWRNMWR